MSFYLHGYGHGYGYGYGHGYGYGYGCGYGSYGFTTGPHARRHATGLREEEDFIGYSRASRERCACGIPLLARD